VRLSQDYAVLTIRFRQEGEAFRDGPDYPKLAELRVAMDSAESTFNAAIAAIARDTSDPTAQALRKDKLIALSKAFRGTLRGLGHQAVLVQYVVLENKLDILLTTPLISIAREVPIKRAALNQMISDYRDILQTPGADPLPDAHALYKLLIGPIAGDLRQAGAHTLMLSLDDALRYLPFAALHDGHDYLLDRYAFAMTTAQTLDKLAMAPTGAAPAKWSVWGLGVTAGHKSEQPPEVFPALPMVGAELEAIAGPHGVLSGQLFLDLQFDERSLRDGLDQAYPIIHIASHFKFDPSSSDSSYLLLGDGTLLSLSQIRNLNFSDVDLLTLSACETAVGGSREGAHGAEVESLGGIAEEGGAHSVLATLWSVNDSSTALLMHAFYQAHSQGLDKSDALRRSQLALLHGGVQLAQLPDDVRSAIRLAAPPANSRADPKIPFAHPYYWAPFVLMGNWQ